MVFTTVLDSEAEEKHNMFQRGKTIMRIKSMMKGMLAVVMAVGARKNLPELSDCPLPLHYIGDCAGERPSNIDHAIKSSYDVAC